MRERVRKLPGGPSMPLTIHLRQEIDRLNRVLGAAGATLRTLRLAIAGTVALSDDLAEALDALHSARVPKRWLKIRCTLGWAWVQFCPDQCTGPSFSLSAKLITPLVCSWEAPSLGSWFQGVLQRHAQLARWLTAGRPKSFWMTGFFNAQVKWMDGWMGLNPQLKIIHFLAGGGSRAQYIA